MGGAPESVYPLVTNLSAQAVDLLDSRLRAEALEDGSRLLERLAVPGRPAEAQQRVGFLGDAAERLPLPGGFAESRRGRFPIALRLGQVASPERRARRSRLVASPTRDSNSSDRARSPAAADSRSRSSWVSVPWVPVDAPRISAARSRCAVAAAAFPRAYSMAVATERDGISIWGSRLSRLAQPVLHERGRRVDLSPLDLDRLRGGRGDEPDGAALPRLPFQEPRGPPETLVPLAGLVELKHARAGEPGHVERVAPLLGDPQSLLDQAKAGLGPSSNHTWSDRLLYARAVSIRARSRWPPPGPPASPPGLRDPPAPAGPSRGTGANAPRRPAARPPGRGSEPSRPTAQPRPGSRSACGRGP